MKIGCFLSCEESGPRELVEQAKRAEAAGFHALWISDHYHPWNDEQGHSPFVWSVIGAIAEATSLRVTTAVTCPTVRIHPAVIAHAAGDHGEMATVSFVVIALRAVEHRCEHGFARPSARRARLALPQGLRGESAA